MTDQNKIFNQMLEKWNRINDFKNCPPLNKQVMAVHDDNIYNAVLEIGGQEEYI